MFHKKKPGSGEPDFTTSRHVVRAGACWCRAS